MTLRLWRLHEHQGITSPRTLMFHRVLHLHGRVHWVPQAPSEQHFKPLPQSPSLMHSWFIGSGQISGTPRGWQIPCVVAGVTQTRPPHPVSQHFSSPWQSKSSRHRTSQIDCMSAARGGQTPRFTGEVHSHEQPNAQHISGAQLSLPLQKSRQICPSGTLTSGQVPPSGNAGMQRKVVYLGVNLFTYFAALYML